MSDKNDPAGACIRGVFYRLLQGLLCFAALTFSPHAPADFYPTRSQNPFTLFQGQPLPLPATVAAPAPAWGFSIDIANSLNTDADSNQAITADFESYYLDTRLQWSMARHRFLIVDVPVIRRSSGFLDNAIDSWHEVFGLPRANRPVVADNQYLLRYERGGTELLRLEQAGTELGDISLQFGMALAAGDDTDMALWAGIELPTGDRASLSGNDAVDLNLALALSNHSIENMEFDLNLGVVLPGDDLFAQNPTRDSVLYAYAAGSWDALDWLRLRLQFEFHEAYYQDDNMDLLNAAGVFVFGGAIRIDRCNLVNIGVSEDIKVGASADVSFLLSWTARACSG